MKNNFPLFLFASLLSLFFYSCEKDRLVTCDRDGPVDRICTEHHYQNGIHIGKIEFYYDDFASLEKKEYLSSKNQLKATELFKYDISGKLLSRFRRNNLDKIICFEQNFYNQGKLSSKIELDSIYSTLAYKYANNQIEKITVSNDISPDYFFKYEYFFNTNDLNRIWKFSPDSSLIEYTVFESFSNGIKRELTYLPNGILKSWVVLTYDNGNIIDKSSFNTMGQLSSQKKYFFDDGLLMEEIEFDQNQNEVKRLEYSYFGHSSDF